MQHGAYCSKPVAHAPAIQGFGQALGGFPCGRLSSTLHTMEEGPLTDWRLTLWAALLPHLPHGRVGLWAPEASLPAHLPTPPQTLLLPTSLACPTLPQGSALQALVVIAGGEPCLPWAPFLAQLATLAAPQAPLLLLVPRTGLVALNQNGWNNTLPKAAWQANLKASGWERFKTQLCGGASLPHPWATAACRLYIAQRKGGGGVRVQFKGKEAAGATASTSPLPC